MTRKPEPQTAHFQMQKYTLLLHDNGVVEVLRYGQPWRKEEWVGDQFMNELATAFFEMKEALEAIQGHSKAIDEHAVGLRALAYQIKTETEPT